MIRRIFNQLLCALAVLLFLATSSDAENLRLVAWFDAPGVPGQPNAEHFILAEPTLNDSGQVAFRSVLDPFSVSDSNLDAIFAGSPGSSQLIAREGDNAPGTAEAFQFFDTEPLLNNAGQVLLTARLSGDVDHRDGIWIGTPGNLQLLARSNTPIAGQTLMVNNIAPDSMALSDSGHAAFYGLASNSRQALWYGTPGNLVIAAIEAGAVPSGSGLPADMTFNSLDASFRSPGMNASGQIAFDAQIRNPSFTINDHSIWAGSPGDLKLVVREETAAPGLPGLQFFSLLTDPLINSSGKVAFGARLTDVTDSIWLGTPGNLQLMARGGDPVPVGSGVTLTDFGTFDELRLSDSNHVGFLGRFEGPGVSAMHDRALMRASTNGLEMVARLGEQAPGMPSGAVFELISNYSINSAGRMAFMGSAVGAGLNALEGRGIWAENADDQLELVVGIGDWINPVTGEIIHAVDATSPGTLQNHGFKEVFQFQMRTAFTLDTDSGTAWNDDHQLAFKVTFSNPQDGSALFLADLDPLQGDYDSDGDVDGRDFLVWQRTDKTPTGLVAWQANYGAGNLTALAAVSEPTSLAMLIACGLAVALNRRSFNNPTSNRIVR